MIKRFPPRHFRVLATDGDGTLTRGGHMAATTCAALLRLRRSGRKLILTTGETPTGLAKFPHLELFDLVVAENGALLYDPATGKETLLARSAPPRLLAALRAAKVQPLKKGRVILSTEFSQEAKVAQALAKAKVAWHIVRNRHDIMILPRTITKATGLAKCLQRFGLTDCDAVAVGDAENDIALLKACGCGVAVANAIPRLKKAATFVTSHGVGAGVVELIDILLKETD